MKTDKDYLYGSDPVLAISVSDVLSLAKDDFGDLPEWIIEKYNQGRLIFASEFIIVKNRLVYKPENDNFANDNFAYPSDMLVYWDSNIWIMNSAYFHEFCKPVKQEKPLEYGYPNHFYNYNIKEFPKIFEMLKNPKMEKYNITIHANAYNIKNLPLPNMFATVIGDNYNWEEISNVWFKVERDYENNLINRTKFQESVEYFYRGSK